MKFNIHAVISIVLGLVFAILAFFYVLASITEETKIYEEVIGESAK